MLKLKQIALFAAFFFGLPASVLAGFVLIGKNGGMPSFSEEFMTITLRDAFSTSLRTI